MLSKFKIRLGKLSTLQIRDRRLPAHLIATDFLHSPKFHNI
ncbi:hypothetical protein [Nostoc sp. KVJ3]|nr:hypothetical protein [Nostoc sp. KVJ3]